MSVPAMMLHLVLERLSRRESRRVPEPNLVMDDPAQNAAFMESGGEDGILAAICIAFFIASFSVGPGVCVWLALSELMPTRIRSAGMGIALLVNQGVSTAIAAVFLPVVGNHGYFAMFLFWAACTVVYFLTAAFFLPETKGKTLEEIEAYFDRETD